MSEKRFMCIDIGYGDDWYITDNGKRLSEIEIVGLLNEQQAEIEQLKSDIEETEISIKLFEDDIATKDKKIEEQQATIDILLEELVNAQQQGYVVDFLHKNEHCSLIPKELEDE